MQYDFRTALAYLCCKDTEFHNNMSLFIHTRSKWDNIEISYQKLYLPAISWYVLVMMKSAVFIAIKSAENWQEKWYLGSNSFHLMSESSYFVFSNACAIVPYSKTHNISNLFFFFFIKIFIYGSVQHLADRYQGCVQFTSHEWCHQVSISIVANN